MVLGRALIPLLLGLGAARLSPRLAAAAGPWLDRILIAVLFAVVAIALLATWKRLADIGGLGLARSPWPSLSGRSSSVTSLGGPDPESRGVVAAASAMRFPALALVLAAALPQGQRVIPVVLAYVLAAFAATTVYGAIMGRRRSKHETPVVPIGAAPRHA